MSDREFLLESNTQDILKYIVIDTGATIKEAMRIFYVSEVYAKLENFDTGLYLESPAYIYELFKDEQINNGFIQREI